MSEQDFLTLFHSLPSHGWLYEDEARLLLKAAEMTTGAILEVGCYYGRSTCLLGALKDSTGQRRIVHAVDPFAGFDTGDPSGAAICLSFRESIRERGLDNVRLHKKRLEMVDDYYLSGITFAYLDGDHSKEGTERQIIKALQLGAEVIAVHDVNDDGQGREIRDVCLNYLGPWKERVKRLAYWVINSSVQV